MKKHDSIKKRVGWRKVLFSALLPAVAFSSAFLVGCGEQGPEGPQGQAGTNGATWFSGLELPSDSMGRLGDFYFKSNSFEIFKFGENGWEFVANLKGAPGKDAKQIVSITKTSSSGVVDVYTILFSDESTAEFSITNGSSGKDGATWHYGNNQPAETLGKQGDFYFDRATSDIYHYSEDGWEKISNIKGDSGKSITKIELKSTSGLVDTYTIYFSDGGSFDFEVTNGAAGLDGANGSTWHTKEGEPKQDLGKNGDLYLDTITYDLYSKVDDVWLKVGNIKGESGTNWYSGSDAPTIAIGKIGDYYFETDTCDVWKYTDKGWEVCSNIKGNAGKGIVKIEQVGTNGLESTYRIIFTDESFFEFKVKDGADGSVGETGNNGATWLTGETYPVDTNGSDNDLYLNTSTYDLFKKIEGAWVKVGNIKGESGSVWFSGTEQPTLSLGKVGDFYLETDRCVVWEYKSTGWVENVCLKGDAGRGVESVEYLSSSGLSDTYKITFTDGTFTTFVITNGAAGSPGSSGSAGQDGSNWIVGTELTGTESNIQKNIDGAKVGDLYFNSQTCNVYKCIADNVWGFISNLKGESGEQGDQGEDGKANHIYIGYDGYVWTGSERTNQKVVDIVGTNNIIDNTLELKNEYYFRNELFNTTSHAVALMSGYEVVNSGSADEYAKTRYSHTTVESISVYVDSDGVLDLGVAKVEDCISKATSGEEIIPTSKSWFNVTKGFNTIEVNLQVGYDETLILGGEHTTVNLYVAKYVEAEDDYGVISSFNLANNQFNSTSSSKDKLIVKVKALTHRIITDTCVSTEEGHGVGCQDCSLVMNIQPHDYSEYNGICSVCMYEHQNHYGEGVAAWDVDVHLKICDTCFIPYMSEEHDYGDYLYDEQYHAKVCSVCDWANPIEHEYENGVCIVCDYEHINHIYTIDSYSLCTICGLAHEEHISEGFVGLDNGQHYATCTICYVPYLYEDHEYGEFETDEWGRSNTCAICNWGYWQEHTYENGVCSTCDYEHATHNYMADNFDGVCTVCRFEHVDHECEGYVGMDNDVHVAFCSICYKPYQSEEHDYDYYQSDEEYHVKACSICDWVIPFEHEYENGICTICEYEHQNHNYDSSAYNGICTVCNFEHIDHVCDNLSGFDYVHVKFCEICYKDFFVEEHTYGEFEAYEDMHYKRCIKCGFEGSWGVHTYENGVCIYCDYGHQNHNYDSSICNGVCTICDFEHINHVCEGYPAIDENVHVKNCEICYKNYLIEEHDLGEYACDESVEDANAHYRMCGTCGYLKIEEHEYRHGACSICAYEHQDCEAEGYETNEYSHYKDCLICDDTFEYGAHSIENGICTVCGYEHATHIWNYSYIDDDKHESKCFVCHETEIVAHSNFEYVKDETTHVIKCVDCCNPILLEDHTFEDGICTVCEYEHNCSLPMSFNYVCVDENWHTPVCSICGSEKENEAHTLYNGVCICDYECEHVWSSGTCTKCEVNHENCDNKGGVTDVGDSAFHGKTCSVCGLFGYESHVLKNGVCELCGYKHEHEWSFGNCSCGEPHTGCTYENGEIDVNNGNQNYHYLVCDVCGAANKPVAHTWSNGSCTVCYVMHFDHISQNEELQSNEFNHYLVCDICDANYNLANHTFGEYKYNLVEHSDENMPEVKHYRVCAMCDYAEIEEHTYSGNTCTKCNAVHVSHVSCFYENKVYLEGFDSSLHYLRCSVCDMGFDLNHEYYDGVCGVCDYKHEDCFTDISTYVSSETEHYYVCDVCGGKYNVGEHNYGDYYHNDSDNYAVSTDKHYRMCEDCCYVEGECHTFLLENKVCKCGVNHDCVGEWNIEFTHKTEDGHAFACNICGSSYGDNHYFYGTPICDWCGYECVNHNWDCGNCRICGISHTDCNYTQINPVDDMCHVEICETCGAPNLVEHTYENGECTVCEHEHQEHEWNNGLCAKCNLVHTDCTFTNGTAESYDDDYHYIECDTCGALNKKEAHNWQVSDANPDSHLIYCSGSACGAGSYEDHSYSNQDGICDICQTEHNCDYFNDFYYAEYEDEHFKECNICFKAVTEAHNYNLCYCACGKVKDHDYSDDWVCEVCGFKHEEHEFDYLTIDSEYCQKGCLVCGVLEEGSSKVKHSGDCGMCAQCGYKFAEEGHVYEYGECIFCGHVHDCENANDAEYVWASKYNHELICSCGKVLSMGDHNFNNSICEDCGGMEE